MVERRPPWLLARGGASAFSSSCSPFAQSAASTHTPADVIHPPMSLLPGSHGKAFCRLWWQRTHQHQFRLGGPDDLDQPLPPVIITLGKIAISAAIGVCRGVFPVSEGAGVFFWLIFITLMLPVEVRIGPTRYPWWQTFMINTYAGLTIRAADRLGHRDLPFPVLPDGAGRTGRNRA